MRDPRAVLGRLQALRELGVRLAIDDFGTGYSSLSYLRWMPIDVLKMDKSFVDDLGSGDQRTALAGTIAGLARTLSMTVVAEGIERPEQADMLHAMQCEFGQGYLFAAPLHPEAFGTAARRALRGLSSPPVRVVRRRLLLCAAQTASPRGRSPRPVRAPAVVALGEPPGSSSRKPDAKPGRSSGTSAPARSRTRPDHRHLPSPRCGSKRRAAPQTPRGRPPPAFDAEQPPQIAT